MGGFQPTAALPCKGKAPTAEKGWRRGKTLNIELLTFTVAPARKERLDFRLNYAPPAKLDDHQFDHLAQSPIYPPFRGRI